MNRRVSVCVGLIFGCAIIANRAQGQASPDGASAPGIPENIKNATNAESYVKDIQQFIKDEAGQLQAPDIAGQAIARKRLIQECPGGTSVSNSYYTVYTREWSNVAKGLVAVGNPMRLRLNAAIITAGLAANATADNSKTLELEPIVDRVLADREGCVALWGIKAARSLIPILLQDPPVHVPGKPVPVPAVSVSKIVSGVVATVKAHIKSELAGFLVVDAYHALVVRDIPGMTDDSVKALLPPLVDPVLDILKFRLSLYAKGTIPLPGAEREVTTFLSSTYMAASPADQTRIVQELVDLVTYAGQRAALYTSKQDMSDLREMLNYASQALTVIAQKVGDQGAVNGLSWLTNIPPSSSPTEIESHTNGVWGTMNLAFKNLTKPPPIPVMQPPPLLAPAASGGLTTPPR